MQQEKKSKTEENKQTDTQKEVKQKEPLSKRFENGVIEFTIEVIFIAIFRFIAIIFKAIIKVIKNLD